MTRGLPSDAEIGVLEALAAEGEPLFAKAVAGAPAFHAPLRFVDPKRRFLILEGSGDDEADAALLGRGHVDLLAEWGEWRIGFAAGRPEAITHQGLPGIRVEFPESVAISRRRLLPRVPVPEGAGLRCVAYSGAAAVFEADVTDVGPGGIGMQAESATSALEPGMTLAGCRLERSGRPPVNVDLELRHTAKTVLDDGRQVVRIGCRFLHPSAEALAVVAEFLATHPAPGR